MAESETMSVDTSIDVQDDPLQDIPNEEVFKLLEESLRSNEVLRAENQMFEKYLKRVEPQINVTSGHITSGVTTQVEISARVGRKRSKSRSSASERSLKLTAEQKCDIAQREIEELREEIERLRDESERILDNYKAVMEEADVRIVEIRKSSYEFERDIVKGSINPRTGNIMAEKLVRYFEDRLRGREALIEKLRLKNSTLKVQRQKLHMQLKQKEEMGEVLHEVDFQQLKIENSQYLEKIDEKNQELLRLKLMAGNTLQVLNAYKKKLSLLTSEATRLNSEISQRQELLRRIDAETELVEHERAKAEGTNKKLRQQLSDYRVPEVIDYITSVSELCELKKKEKIWDRKVDIAKMAVNRHKKMWQQIRRGNTNVL